MGIFYTNIALYKVEHNQTVEFLQKEKRISYVSPQQENFIVVYDKETEDQDTKVLVDLTSKLSKTLSCNALASLVHDGDIFCYWLFENGKLIDEYNSSPNYFENEGDEPVAPTGGNAKKLCFAFDKKESLSEVIKVFEIAKETTINLGNDSDTNLLGEEIHLELVKKLGMPLFTVEIGYYTIENNFLPSEFEKSSFTLVGSN